MSIGPDLAAWADRCRADGDQPDGLFPEPERVAEPAPEPTTKRERDQARWLDLIRSGMHPLMCSTEVGHLTLHPDAARDLDPDGAGPRCGGCVHRRTTQHHGRTYPKCWARGHARVSNGPATDVRRYWPACPDYEGDA